MYQQDDYQIHSDATGYLMLARQKYQEDLSMEEMGHPVEPPPGIIYRIAADLAMEDQQYAVVIVLAKMGLTTDPDPATLHALQALRDAATSKLPSVSH